jgi:hypothetical protein
VVVWNKFQKIPVLIKEGIKKYEIDFSQTVKETIPISQPLIEQDEILEFKADKYSVYEGELTTINWKVKGAGKIHISNMGDVHERTGTKKVVLNNTTDYVLTVGAMNRSFTIHVQPKPASIPQAAIAAKTIVSIPSAFVNVRPVSRIKKRIVWTTFVAVLLTVASFYFIQSISENKPKKISAAEAHVAPPKETLFSQSGIMSFLTQLYSSYNERDLNSIMSYYTSPMREYYNSTLLTNDSLSTVIKNLFILPTYYQCTPDFKTLVFQPLGKNCKVIITINEKVKPGRNRKTNAYTTTIEYLIDPSYKIISEKSVTK